MENTIKSLGFDELQVEINETEARMRLIREKFEAILASEKFSSVERELKGDSWELWDIVNDVAYQLDGQVDEETKEFWLNSYC